MKSRGGGGRADLELVEAQREVQDVGELPGQSLLLLQVLSGSGAGAGEDVQQTLQAGLCGDALESTSLVSGQTVT